MRAYLQKPGASQQPAASTILGRSRVAQSRKENTFLYAQRSIEDPAVQRSEETGAGDVERGPANERTAGGGHSFGQIPLHASGPLTARQDSGAASSNAYTVKGNKPCGQCQADDLAVSDGPAPPTLDQEPATAEEVAPTQPAEPTEATEPASPEAAPAQEQEPATPAVSPPDKTDERVRDAPTQTYMVPFDRHPQAAPGERIIFSAEYTDPTPGNYQLEYSTTGGHFDSATGPTSRTIAGLTSGNVNFYVPTPWDGTSAVQVVLKLKKIADSSIVQTVTWDFGLKKNYPTTMTQQENSDERNLPGIYHYDIGPALATGTKPYYEHMTILERFGNWSLANIVPADIKEDYRTANGLTTAAAVSQHFIGNYTGSNGTFTVNAKDQIGDRHSGYPDLSNLVSKLVAPKEIQVALPQTYEAKPGTALGNYTITRILKADGTTWKVKKG